MIKKKPLEILDAMLVSDMREIKQGLETADKMLASDIQEIKRWGRPQIYDDDFHKKERERVRRLRLPK